MPKKLVRTFAALHRADAARSGGIVQAPSTTSPPPPRRRHRDRDQGARDARQVRQGADHPDHGDGKEIARWETAICPSVIGQQPELIRFVTQRLQAIAAAAGAPVNANPKCTANIQIIFTTTPQQLLDQVRKDDPDYLGYATTSDQWEKLATVDRPVQAWYTTETIDFDGVHRMDSGRKLGSGVRMANFSAFAGCPTVWPTAIP